jgi:hypothetical protein
MLNQALLLPLGQILQLLLELKLRVMDSCRQVQQQQQRVLVLLGCQKHTRSCHWMTLSWTRL